MDLNPKAAAVMTKQMYRAGMQDTYQKDTVHYTVLTDRETAKAALQRVEEKVWSELPEWLPRRKLTVGYEYLNLKEK